MKMDPESLYLQLSQLVAEMPPLGGRGFPTVETYRWLGRATKLVEQSGNAADTIGISHASESLGGDRGIVSAQKIQAIIFRALAHAEALAPAAARGGVVAVGEGFTAVQVISKVLAEAKQDVLIIDAYMDGKVFTDFAPLATKGVTVRLLSDSFYTKSATVLPYFERWVQQFAQDRPLEVRLSQPRALHDRLILLDRALVYSVTQSLKDFAARSPALVQRIDPDLAAMKVAHYADVWANATHVS